MKESLINEYFMEYAGRMAEIRRLSSPDIKVLDDAEDYSERLRHNFERIGLLAGKNREMLDKVLYPLLNETRELSPEEIALMRRLSESLLNMGGVEDYENLDLPVTSLISERLLKDAEEKNEINELVRQLDVEIDVCYSLMNMTGRIYTNPGFAEKYRSRGLAISRVFWQIMDKKHFLNIRDMESREMVITNVRFSAVFYEGVSGDVEMLGKGLDLLDKMLELMYDRFYREAVPEFDWIYFKYRVLEYCLQGVEGNNMRGFSHEQLRRIADRADDMEKLCEEYSSKLSDFVGFGFVPVLIARARYLAGRMGRKEYFSFLCGAYKKRNRMDFSADGSLYNILIPLEIIGIFGEKRRTAEETFMLGDIYRNLSAYIFHMPSTGALSYCMEYFSVIIKGFIEVPSGVSFEHFVLQCLAALHPPTYIHSVMVGRLTECMCGHLIELRPELFIGIKGCGSVVEVRERAEEIQNFAFHAAICHDFGKIYIFDTIFVYGRKLLDFEFDIIKSHPGLGYDMLRSHSSTREYADVAKGHHRWYDDSKGYPEEFETSKSPYKVIIDLVQCADCMDAATDSVGRSYNRGKSLSDFKEELAEGGGTRYAPWLIDLFDHKEVFEDIEYMLSKGRGRQYRETFNLLKDVQDNG